MSRTHFLFMFTELTSDSVSCRSVQTLLADAEQYADPAWNAKFYDDIAPHVRGKRAVSRVICEVRRTLFASIGCRICPYFVAWLLFRHSECATRSERRDCDPERQRCALPGRVVLRESRYVTLMSLCRIAPLTQVHTSTGQTLMMGRLTSIGSRRARTASLSQLVVSVLAVNA